MVIYLNLNMHAQTHTYHCKYLYLLYKSPTSRQCKSSYAISRHIACACAAFGVPACLVMLLFGENQLKFHQIINKSTSPSAANSIQYLIAHHARTIEGNCIHTGASGDDCGGNVVVRASKQWRLLQLAVAKCSLRIV